MPGLSRPNGYGHKNVYVKTSSDIDGLISNALVSVSQAQARSVGLTRDVGLAQVVLRRVGEGSICSGSDTLCHSVLRGREGSGSLQGHHTEYCDPHPRQASSSPAPRLSTAAAHPQPGGTTTSAHRRGSPSRPVPGCYQQVQGYPPRFAAEQCIRT
ncbi:uncharacterized protein B0I36DRAFT_354233 [Microdochium trichocladiopsis]|uniref:Uncharacterized protein n=1 Tax=Microdochium trichocladiopsis TaxID=1682393 RepID=A0A9P8XWT9_9PEZI|nr:uncharacterized protein B0I36DRAFT_354233 [Microdochium trichocladiopsis]KAH7021604.1 hypothetical protein B0I36DRAFT_354233 [Microdochium trichocladiopsis]